MPTIATRPVRVLTATEEEEATPMSEISPEQRTAFEAAAFRGCSSICANAATSRTST